MNKGELIEAVAGSAGLSRADATKAVDAVLDSITGTLANGGSVSLVGFGTFAGHKVEICLAQDPALRQSPVVHKCLVDEQIAQVAVLEIDQIWRDVDKGLEPCLAFSKRFLSLDPIAQLSLCHLVQARSLQG